MGFNSDDHISLIINNDTKSTTYFRNIEDYSNELSFNFEFLFWVFVIRFDFECLFVLMASTKIT